MNIRKNEVLRYLGYRNQQIDVELQAQIDSCIREITEISTPHFTYKLYNITKIEQEEIVLDDTLILEGNSITKHLEFCSKCIILAATLGIEVDRKIRKYQLTDMTRAVILDACAGEAIESICNDGEKEIKRIATGKGYYITSRFSPGYGDFSIEIQPKILMHLKASSRIGLTSTQEHLLLPRKSVTALIGLSREPIKNSNIRCDICNTNGNCIYQREEQGCELFKK